jgi:hypothetical protein
MAVDLRQHRRRQLLRGNKPMAREKMAMECLPLCQTPHTMTRSMVRPHFYRNYVYLSRKGSAGSGKGVTDSLSIFRGRFYRFWEGGHTVLPVLERGSQIDRQTNAINIVDWL